MSVAKKSVFYSFHFDNDYWRTMQIRNIGAINKDEPISKNEWEEVRKGKDPAIRKWIEENLKNKHCTIVLIGFKTYKRSWILYEIEKSWELGIGLFGIYIHNLKDSDGKQSTKGKNPFEEVYIDTPNGYENLSGYVDIHYSSSADSKFVYEVISDNLEKWVENAISRRKLQKYWGR